MITLRAVRTRRSAALQRRDAVEQVDDEADGGVVEREAGPQPLDPGHRGDLAGREPQPPRRVAGGVDAPEGDQPADQVGMQPAAAREGVQAQPRRWSLTRA